MGFDWLSSRTIVCRIHNRQKRSIGLGCPMCLPRDVLAVDVKIWPLDPQEVVHKKLEDEEFLLLCGPGCQCSRIC